MNRSWALIVIRCETTDWIRKIRTEPPDGRSWPRRLLVYRRETVRLAATEWRKGLRFRRQEQTLPRLCLRQPRHLILARSTSNGSSSLRLLWKIRALDHRQSLGWSDKPARTGFRCVYCIFCQSMFSLHSSLESEWCCQSEYCHPSERLLILSLLNESA